MSRKKKLRKLFERGTVLNPQHLLGRNGSEAEWTVRMLTGPVLDLGFLRHRMRFRLEEGVSKKARRVLGCNVLREDSCWGNFVVWAGDSSAPTTIDHDVDGNGFSRRLFAEICQTDYAFLIVGRLHVRLLGSEWFVGYFTLRRRGDRGRRR